MSASFVSAANTRALYARIAELEKDNEKLKKEKEEYEAVEVFIMECFRAGDFDKALHAHLCKLMRTAKSCLPTCRSGL